MIRKTPHFLRFWQSGDKTSLYYIKLPENAKQGSFLKNQFFSFACWDAQKSYQVKIIHGKIKIPVNLSMETGPPKLRANVYIFCTNVADHIKAWPLNLIVFQIFV